MESLKINSLVTVIGILEIEDNATPSSTSDGFDANFEDSYPSDKVPRIHCLSIQQLDNDTLTDDNLMKFPSSSSEHLLGGFLRELF